MLVASLFRLPNECLDLIASQMKRAELKRFSLVNKHLREICCRHLFRRVKIKYSESSFQELQRIMWSNIGRHTHYVLYEVPDLLRRDILDFGIFSRELYPFADYIAESQEIEAHFEGHNFPPYMSVYDKLFEICSEQYRIIDQSLDSNALISTINHMPRLKAIEITVRPAVPQWLISILNRGLILENEGSFRYHLQTTLNTLNAMEDYNLKFKGLQLPKSFLRRYPHFGRISKSLPHIIGISDALRYERAAMELQALAYHPIDMFSCDNWLCRSVFEIFLAYHVVSSTPPPEEAVSTAVMHHSIDDDGQNWAYTMWEPGWCVRVQRRIRAMD